MRIHDILIVHFVENIHQDLAARLVYPLVWKASVFMFLMPTNHHLSIVIAIRHLP